MFGEYFWAVVTALATIAALADWIRTHLRQGWRAWVYPVAITALTAISTQQFLENHELRSIKNEARILLSTWPEVADLPFRTKGERIGVVLSGLSFIEKYRKEFPESYEAAKRLVEVRGQGFKPPQAADAKYDEYGLLEDLASAMIQLVSSIAGQRVAHHSD